MCMYKADDANKLSNYINIFFFIIHIFSFPFPKRVKKCNGELITSGINQAIHTCMLLSLIALIKFQKRYKQVGKSLDVMKIY